MEYRPEYAKGQILVVFKNNCSEDFACDFGRTIGYRLSDEDYKHIDAYIFKTELGKEKEAIERFKAYPEFVDWADLRDIKIESRWDSLEQAIDKVQELYDNIELPDNQYNQKLDEICIYLKQLKLN